MYFSKTEKGQAEIESSARQLPQALRMLLLLVDGRRSAVELLQLIPGAKADALRALRAGGYIVATPAPPSARHASPAAAAATQPAPAAAAVLTRQARGQIERSLKRALGPAADSLIDSMRQARSTQELAAVLDAARRAITNARGKDSGDEFASRYGGFDGG